jgi:DNA repair exonuclease SbcCD nuclease subunit
MADVHLGARHDDLGPAAAAQRERQFAAFHRAIELALAEKADLVLICGDLFDSNSQPKRSVERAATELGRLVDRHIPVVIIPGTHDCYEPSSIYRVFDLAEMAGAQPDSHAVTVLTDTKRSVHFPQIDTTVHGFVYPTKRAPGSPLAGFKVDAGGSTLNVGMIHGSFPIPGKFDQDEVLFNEDEVAASGLDYLALGHWHSFREGRAGESAWAYSGAPEPVALDQDGSGQVLLVELSKRDAATPAKVSVKPVQVGRTTFEKLELDAAAITSQGELEKMLRERADTDRVLDVRIRGVKPDDLDLHVDELEKQLQGAFLRLRVRDSSVASLPETPLAPADTILGAFARDFGARIAEYEERGETERAGELREALRLGILLLDDTQRVTLA